MPQSPKEKASKEKIPKLLLSPAVVMFLLALSTLLFDDVIIFNSSDLDELSEQNSRKLQSLTQLLVCMGPDQGLPALQDAAAAINTLQTQIKNIQFHITNDPQNRCAIQLYVRPTSLEYLPTVLGQADLTTNTVSISPRAYLQLTEECTNNEMVFIHEILHLYFGFLDGYIFQDPEDPAHSLLETDVMHAKRSEQNCNVLSDKEIAYLGNEYLQAQLLQLLNQRILIPSHLIVK